MANDRKCSEYQDFALETYRHASRYGDSPCECPFLPRRGIFFWPMEKSSFDQRRLRLWTRVLRLMEEDKILIPIQESPKKMDIRDMRYHFNPIHYRPPYYKIQKIKWPHVKEWYFEYMNKVPEYNPTIGPEKPIKISNFPLVKRTSDIKFHHQSSSPLPNIQYSNYSINKISEGPKIPDMSNSNPVLPRILGSRIQEPLEDSSMHELKVLTYARGEEARKLPQLESSTGGLQTCQGCHRCAFRTEYPDDLFEGRIHQSSRNGEPKTECEYIICHECKELFDDFQENNFKTHLESPEHTRNHLLRLKKAKKSPNETPSSKKRLFNLSRYSTNKGYANVTDYITKGPIASTSQEKSSLSLPLEDTNKLYLCPTEPIISSTTPEKKPINTDAISPINSLQSSSDDRDLSNVKPPKEDDPTSSSDDVDNDNPDVPSVEQNNTHDPSSDILDQSNDVDNRIKSLHIQQKKTDSRLSIFEANMISAQLSLRDLTLQVETGSIRTQALIRSFLRHDDAIKLLQKDATEGKVITDIMEGAIDAMEGHTKSEVISNRLDRQERGLKALQKDLKSKVDDLSCWLKVVDRHTNDISTLKQRVWINGQINNSGDSNLHLVQKLEHQIRIQQEATQSFMMQTEQRFDTMVRQFSEEVNMLQRMDEEKQRQIMNLKSQMGLKFAHMEQKSASYRRSKK
ncbi:hypothetical protein GcM1_237116 [Golovinomyces cichoracearum]|uniref:Uncharacterized protein n=1 Tax=Golovinomyces cichoracearum TaxID=62708 RepID=A0A420IK44_9PEZI|nr:hypothetical protein GcM1_237116 [Golovinomyces cichoracearum]